MIEHKGDIWEFVENADAVCVTTNGIVKDDGRAVMGAGIALEVATRFPEVPSILGGLIKTYGNHPVILGLLKRDQRGLMLAPYDDSKARDLFQQKHWSGGTFLVSFPTKHHWRDKSDIALILRSANILNHLADYWKLQKVALPRPGCGNGGLVWEDVKPALEAHLNDRYTIVHK